MQDPLEEIRSLLKQRRPQEALAALDELPPTDEAELLERQRLRVYALEALGMLEQAFSVRESITLSPHAEIYDHHSAGVDAVRLKQFDKAYPYLTRAIELSITENDSYYLSVCYCLRAYVHAQRGDVPSTMQDLAHLEDDHELGWIPNVPKLTKDYLISLAKLRAQQ
ncbi:MAG: hypothetical protein JNL25_02960 [Rhodospirillaceae bacterium]|nr:hypothetical protein [Rhodospirillaceae bacterium]